MSITGHHFGGRTHEPGYINVGNIGRVVSVLAGGALIGTALARRTKPAGLLALAGIPLLHRGITGHCAVQSALGIDTAHRTNIGRIAHHDDKPVSTENFNPGAEDIVTESSMESFPASDPPSGW